MNYKRATGLLKVGQYSQTFTVHLEDIAFMKDNMLSLIKLLNTLYLLPPNKKIATSVTYSISDSVKMCLFLSHGCVLWCKVAV